MGKADFKQTWNKVTDASKKAGKAVGATMVKAGKTTAKYAEKAGKATAKYAEKAGKATAAAAERTSLKIRTNVSELHKRNVERRESENEGGKKTFTKKINSVSAKVLIFAVVPAFVMTLLGMVLIASTASNSCTYIARDEVAALAETISYRYDTVSKGELSAISQNNSSIELAVYDGKNLKVGTYNAPLKIDDAVWESLKKEGIYEAKLTIGEQKYIVHYKLIRNEMGQPGGAVLAAYGMKEAKRVSGLAFATNAIILFVLLVILTIPSLPVAIKLGRDLQKSLHTVEIVANGDLSVRVSDDIKNRRDEIGTVAKAIDRLAVNFSDLISSLDESSGRLDLISAEFGDGFDTIIDSIKSVNRAVEEIARGASSQAEETQAVNDKFANIDVSITATSEGVEALSASSESMKEYNKTAQNTIEEIERLSEETSKSVVEIKEQTSRTNKSVMQIRNATDMIADIASQTNLLSLNASIEAARAGEMGRGFAVVASEIRNLADQSKQSAQDIANIVKELIKNSNISVQAMEKTSEIMAKQSEGINTSKEVFEKLNGEIGAVSEAVLHISKEVKALAASKTEAVSSMQNLAAIAQENAAGTWETSASMNTLSEVVDKSKANTEEIRRLARGLDEQIKKVTV